MRLPKVNMWKAAAALVGCLAAVSPVGAAPPGWAPPSWARPAYPWPRNTLYVAPQVGSGPIYGAGSSPYNIGPFARPGYFVPPVTVLPPAAPARLSDYGLGIWFRISSGGCRVTGVQPGSPAAQLGLEAGDVIEAISLTPPPDTRYTSITDAGDWDAVLSNAADYLRLRIRDRRTGAVVYRNLYRN